MSNNIFRHTLPRISSAGKIWAASVAIALSLMLPMTADAAQVANTSSLQTWWHDNYDLNSSSLPADDKVRRSTFYDVRVSTASSSTQYDSFTYMSIPRGGKAKWEYSSEDGAEFSAEAKLSMSWSSFLYSEDAWVYVSETDGKTISSVNDVKIRPSALNLVKELVDSKTVRIKVPYSAKGYRFSVEFNNQLYTAYNDMSGASGRLNTSSGREIHTEPRNAILIFAEPILTGDQANRLIPKDSDGSIYYPPQGQVDNLNNISQSIVFFKPGTYYMPWNYHALLPANVKWVYLAPGAYVKGAFRFPNDNQSVYKVTGYGALSGEKYVYEPDTANGYHHKTASNCHSTCVKMLQFQSANAQQYLDLQGVTIVEPPYHSFVVYGNEDTFEMRVENYKQVGSWYWQTDGIELYTNSRMNNTFFHANDDVLKMYHNNTTVDNTVIWKNENGPVIQWGWTTRNLDNINVKDTYVIHNRMWWKDKKINTCIINESPHWEDTASMTKGDPNTWEKNLTFENIYVEGRTNCAIRIYALSSLENVLIKNLKIDAWSDLDSDGTISEFKRLSNSSGQKVTIGNESTQGRGLKLENYSVGGTYITRAANNWQADKLGKLGFDAELFDNWNAWQSAPQQSSSSSSSPSTSSSAPATSSSSSSSSNSSTGCQQQLISFNAIADQQINTTVRLNATVASGLPIVYSVQSGAASIAGDMLTTGSEPGPVTVVASQAGNSAYCAASTSRTFNVLGNPTTPIWLAGTFSNWSLNPMEWNATSLAFETTLNLNSGNYQLKFANTGNWQGKDWGNTSGLSGTVKESTGGLPNLTFSLAQAGTYKISFNPSSLSYSIVAITPMWVAGTFNNWSLKSMQSSGTTYTFTQTFSAGNYQLKFANTSGWTGKDWGNTSGLEGFAKESTGGLPNLSFTITQSGTYTITFNPTTLAYSIK